MLELACAVPPLGRPRRGPLCEHVLEIIHEVVPVAGHAHEAVVGGAGLADQALRCERLLASHAPAVLSFGVKLHGLVVEKHGVKLARDLPPLLANQRAHGKHAVGGGASVRVLAREAGLFGGARQVRVVEEQTRVPVVAPLARQGQHGRVQDTLGIHVQRKKLVGDFARIPRR